jgi:hypothetical protein
MTTPRRIVLTLSPELYARLEARAAEGRLDAREWALRALQTAVSHPESKAARERRRREAGFTLLSLLASSTGSGQAGHPDGEGSPHAPNP